MARIRRYKAIQIQNRCEPTLCHKISFIILAAVIFTTILVNPPRPVEKNRSDHQPWFPDEIKVYQPQKQVFPAPRRGDQFPRWYKFLSDQEQFQKNKGPVKIGLVNVGNSFSREEGEILQEVNKDLMTQVKVYYQPVPDHVRWENLFPEWIKEPESASVPVSDLGENKCPDIPMPRIRDYQGLNAVVARVPCKDGESVGLTSRGKRGYKDLYRLQVNLIVANLVVKSSRITSSFDGIEEGEVYAVFFGSCGPMVELFRCEDLLWHEGNISIYKPNLRKLAHRVLMPVGTCQISPPLAEPGNLLLLLLLILFDFVCFGRINFESE